MPTSFPGRHSWRRGEGSRRAPKTSNPANSCRQRCTQATGSSSRQASPPALPRLQHPGSLQQCHLLPQSGLLPGSGTRQPSSLEPHGIASLRRRPQSFLERLWPCSSCPELCFPSRWVQGLAGSERHPPHAGRLRHAGSGYISTRGCCLRAKGSRGEIKRLDKKKKQKHLSSITSPLHKRRRAFPTGLEGALPSWAALPFRTQSPSGGPRCHRARRARGDCAEHPTQQPKQRGATPQPFCLSLPR